MDLHWLWYRSWRNYQVPHKSCFKILSFTWFTQPFHPFNVRWNQAFIQLCQCYRWNIQKYFVKRNLNCWQKKHGYHCIEWKYLYRREFTRWHFSRPIFIFSVFESRMNICLNLNSWEYFIRPFCLTVFILRLLTNTFIPCFRRRLISWTKT